MSAAGGGGEDVEQGVAGNLGDVSGTARAGGGAATEAIQHRDLAEVITGGDEVENLFLRAGGADDFDFAPEDEIDAVGFFPFLKKVGAIRVGLAGPCSREAGRARRW